EPVEPVEPVEPTSAQAQPTTDLDRPAYQRRGLDPLNERSSPWPEGAPPTMVDLVGPPVQQTPRTMADLYSQPLPVDPFTEWEQHAAVPQPAQPPLQLPYSPTIYPDPTGVAQVGQMPTEQEVAQRRYAPQPADPTPEQQTREQLRSMLT